MKFLARERGDELLLTSSGAILRPQNSQLGFTLKFKGTNRAASVRGDEELAGHRNYFHGNDPSEWHTSVPTFKKVIYENIYPGVRLTYYGNHRQVEYDFEIAPRADPHAIRLTFDGEVRLRISASGDLVLRRKNLQVIFFQTNRLPPRLVPKRA